jgi:hypothetical protein
MLGTGSGSFDPDTLVILETAFDEAARSSRPKTPTLAPLPSKCWDYAFLCCGR